jgi:hypothetical protein
LLPEGDYKLFAVSARFPRNLTPHLTLTPVREGVYEAKVLGLRIRLIVLNQLAQAEQNAMLLLFSTHEESLRYGREHYRPHSPESSTLLFQLFRLYEEDPEMVDKLKEFVRQTREELLRNLTPEERLKVLNSLPVEDRLKGLSAEEVAKALPPEERLKGLSAEEVANALAPEVLAALARKLTADGSPPKP